MPFHERFRWALMSGTAGAAIDTSPPAAPPLSRADSSAQQSRECGDRVLLPASVLEKLAAEFGDDFPEPLTFELLGRGSMCYVGVQEFTSSPGVVQIPQAVFHALGLKAENQRAAGDMLALRHVRLPKATALTVQPFTADFLDIADHRAFLENGLRTSFTALFAGQVVSLRNEGVSHQLLITALEPAGARACVILNTDCNVTTLPPLGPAAGGRAALSYLRPGEAVTGEAEQDKYTYYSFAYPPGVDPTAFVPKVALSTLPAAGPTSPVVTAAAGGDADADAYISTHPLRKPTLLNHTWALNTVGAGSILLVPEAEDVLPGDAPVSTRWMMRRAPPPQAPAEASVAPSYYVGVTGYKGRAGFSLTVSFVPADEVPPPPPAAAAGGAEAGRGAGVTGLRVPSSGVPGAASSAPSAPASDAADAAGRRQCGNCAAWVAAANFVLHAAQCARINVRCPHAGCGAVLRRGPAAFDAHWHCPECARVMPRAVGEKHAALFHTPAPCTNGCGLLRPVPELRRHVRDECPRRLLLCRFCGDMVRAGAPPADHEDRLRGLSEHESYCGSRSAPCGVCGLSLPMKKHDRHFALVHPAAAYAAPGFFAATSAATAAGAAEGDGAAAAGAAMAVDGSSGSAGSAGVGGAWTCAACTFESGPRAAACEMCGTARLGGADHPGDDDAPVGRLPTTSSAVASAWDCAVCSYRNEYGGDGGGSCHMCEAARPGSGAEAAAGGGGDYSGFSSSGGRVEPASAPSAPTAYSRAPVMCRNQCCANAVSRYAHGDAAELGLCSRCHAQFAEESAGDPEMVAGALATVYAAQLAAGCGDASCRNPHCCTGRTRSGAPVVAIAPAALPVAAPVLQRAASISEELASLLGDASASQPRYYVCVAEHQRIVIPSRPVPALPSAPPADDAPAEGGLAGALGAGVSWLVQGLTGGSSSSASGAVAPPVAPPAAPAAASAGAVPGAAETAAGAGGAQRGSGAGAPAPFVTGPSVAAARAVGARKAAANVASAHW